MRAKLPGLFSGLAVFLLVCFFATAFFCVLGSLREFTPCTCTIESIKTKLSYSYPADTVCLINSMSVCLCEGSRAPESAVIESTCGAVGVVQNAKKAAFRFRASVLYSGYTWDNDPPRAFMHLFVGLITLGVVLMTLSILGMCLVARYNWQHIEEEEEEEGEEEGGEVTNGWIQAA